MLETLTMDVSSYEGLLAVLEPERRALLGHPIYQAVDTRSALRAFMQVHVFAVWDFMSLLKDLQRRLTCTTVPWTPPRSATAARLVNAIVLDEESDLIDLPGGDGPRPMSHFELYRLALREVGADGAPIDGSMTRLAQGASLDEALAPTPAHVRGFVRATFAAIGSPDDEVPAASFLIGREDLVPEMFRRLLPVVGPQAPAFRCYLERHIEVDEGEHGPLARRLLGALCADDPAPWRRAADAARAALIARKALWDGCLNELAASRSIAPSAVSA